ncbi:MAG TPA: sigma-70 family RNA polymerase sigma factor [Streptosporangiaceae bacterium]|jgi:RNA polymerase sigma factor (sigma-70 family)
MGDGLDQGVGTVPRTGRPVRLARLLELAQDGQTAALHEVVRELNPLLWHVARSQGLAADEAADVVQTTWLELLRRLHEIRSPQALTAWLVSVTRRDAMRVHRAGRRHAHGGGDVLESLADPGPDLGEQAAAAERRRVLIRHFRTLSQRCQALLRVVAQVDRPDYDDVASALAMPRGSIGPTRGRCLARLREMLLADPQWGTG